MLYLCDASRVKADFTDYNPQKPDDADKFVWYRSAKNDVTKPDGD